MKEQLKSEYLKFIMNPWHWLIIGALLLCVPALVIFLNNKPDQLTLQFVLEQLLQSLYLGQAGFVSLAVLFIGQEFTGSSLRTSFLTCPNRLKFIICKLAIVLCMEIVLLVAVISLCILLAQGYYNINLLSNIKHVLTILFHACISILTFSLLSGIFVFISQSFILILGISLSLLLGLGQMLLQFSSFFRNLPLLASMNCFYTHPLSALLSSVASLGIQIVWLLIVFVFATLILIGRNDRLKTGDVLSFSRLVL